jgi:hypothetical protein
MNPLLLCIGFITVAGYLIIRSIYRLYLHPLSKFPGPKLAAVSHLYEFYYDVAKGGKFIWEIQRMHEQYGAHLGRCLGELGMLVSNKVINTRPHSENQSARAPHQGSILL